MSKREINRLLLLSPVRRLSFYNTPPRHPDSRGSGSWVTVWTLRCGSATNIDTEVNTGTRMKFWETPDVDLFIYRTALGSRCCRLAWFMPVTQKSFTYDASIFSGILYHELNETFQDSDYPIALRPYRKCNKRQVRATHSSKFPAGYGYLSLDLSISHI